MKKTTILLITMLLFVFGVSTAAANVPEMADELMKAHINKQPIPLLSQTNPELDVKMAYDVQRAYVKQRLAGDFIGGFKAGFTAAAVQNKFGVNEAAVAVLYGKRMYTGTPVVKPSVPGMVIETEIGFVIGETIAKPLKDIDEFKAKISGVMPAVELPNMRFTDMKLVKGIDVIAANIAADSSIAGKKIKPGGIDLNEIVVTLYRDGKLVYQGKGADALGDQWKTALWLVNTVIEQGYELKPGQIIITGALGQVVPAVPGNYEAFWGPLGKISFEIK